MDIKGRWKERSPSRPSLFIALLVIGLSLLQGCVESASRMQSSKPIFNEITPSPEFTISTDGWRPIIPPSTRAPPKTEEEMRKVVDDLPPLQSKQRVTPNRFPEENPVITLEGLSPPPIDVITDSEQAGDNMAQLRLRRQKKRPPFKTVDAPVIVSAGSEPLGFRVNSEPHFVRHFPDLQEAQFRHRPIETNSGTVYRGVHAPLQDSPFLAPSQEMLPPTAPSRPFASIAEGQQFHLRPQQPGFHGPHIIFHGQLPIPQQQRYPTVARPSDPLPGSLLRPHGERAPLTDSTAFRTGGSNFHHRPVPVQWPNPLIDGRPSFSVTSIPLVEDRPWPSSAHHNGERYQDTTRESFSHHGGSQTIRGSSEEKPQKEATQAGATTAIVPEVYKSPFGSAPSTKGKGKLQREQAQQQFHTTSLLEHSSTLSTGHVPKQQSPISPSQRDPNIGLRPSKTSAAEAAFPVRNSKKPFRENNDGKTFNQGLDGSDSEAMQNLREKQRPDAFVSEIQREERPGLSDPTKFRQNTNYRKKPEEIHVDSNLKMTDHFLPVSMPTRENFPSSSESTTGQRGGQGLRVRKRRPKPTAQRQQIQSSRPHETQDMQKPQQDAYQPQTHYQQQEIHQQQNSQQKQEQHRHHIHQQTQEIHQSQTFLQQPEDSQQSQSILQQQQDTYNQQKEVQLQQEDIHQQPQEVHQIRKRPRRPTRIRKPVKESSIEATFQKGENYLHPTGQAIVQEQEEPHRQKFRESRPRPILRTRRPRPGASPSPLPIQNSATAPDDAGFVKDELPFDKPKKVRVRPLIRPENTDVNNDRENEQFPSSTASGTSGPSGPGTYFEQNQEIRNDDKQQHLKENEQLLQEDKKKDVENVHSQADVSESIAFEDLIVIDATTEKAVEIEDMAEEEDEKVIVNEFSIDPTNTVPQETSTFTATSEAPVLSTTEAQTTTVTPTSSAFGIRSRLRAGSRPRFSVKDYRERLNRLSQLSGRGRNNTESSAEAEDIGTTGVGTGPSAPSRERWYPGRRQQQTLQEQQQLNLQRLQASNRNEGETQSEKPKTEGRDRYRPRPPALRPRPVTGDSNKNDEVMSNTKGRNDEASTTTTSRYRSRFGGRFSTTTQASSDTDITTTESPTSRRRGILTTYGMRRPYPLKVRLGATTSTEAAETQTPAETTPMMVVSETTTTTMPESTETPTTTTTTTTVAPTTTTTEVYVSKVVENEVTMRSNGDSVITKDSDATVSESSTEITEVVRLQDSNIREHEPIEAGNEVPNIESEGGNEEADEDAISPAQRVSDLTLWATTGNSGGARGNGSRNGGLVTFSAVPYPSTAFSSRLVTMATEDPILPLEAFFFGPSPSSNSNERKR